ncbi:MULTISPECIES: acyltransferase family protein [Streptomyces]|uniref:Acyltransferase family protein n=1 Tax=Streptomyces mirabilis TaxID=68239 RepID=A0ABU3UTV7_9ACTN|nr:MULTISPECIES: acyltransferase family protein [Streptomyces]MCX5349261.1 acyltransferase family protein [Streptomyces mirabilis]MDU8997360.1 acyltransferase family protein [Streptomyces mirabilis]QDN87761.1 acyltransferase family protein [Streptomyces sp. RLB3-6]QDO08581.1 acyltransferase family protein [Streptomyces sp. S1D4-23]
MTNSLHPNGPRRTPLPPAEQPVEGVPTARWAPSRPSDRTSKPAGATATTASADATATRPGKPRDAFFDNAKYLAIVLVAVGHAWEPLKGQSRALEAAYMVVYAFHMPAFIIISGYFSRSFDMRADRLKRLVTGVAVPYVVFEVAYVLFKRWADDDPSLPVSLLDPWFLTWFLCALFIWRLSTPLWKLVRRPLPLALLVAMLATTSPSIGDDLDLQRTLQFLPFFVLGLCMKPEHFQLVRRREVRILSVPVFAAALVVSWWAVPRMNPGWFYHRDSAQELGAPWWVGPVMVLALLGCSLLLTACFFAWVPRRRMWFTALGAGTLYGYLLHGFLVKGGDYWGWFDHEWLHRPLGEIFVTLVAGVAVTLLCTAPVRRVFRFAMEPSMEWAFKRDATEPAREWAKAPA